MTLIDFLSFTMTLIDTHAHLTFDELAGQIDAVLARSVEAQVTRWITVGTDKGDNEKVLGLIERYENLWGALGYHPHDAKDVTDADMELLKAQLSGEKIVAVGECGLDYHYMHSPAKIQQTANAGGYPLARGLG
jgi:TatD DNase family protein